MADNPDPADEIIQSARAPLTDSTHITWAVNDGVRDDVTLTKIGVACINERGDIPLKFNPARTTENIILCRKSGD